MTTPEIFSRLAEVQQEITEMTNVAVGEYDAATNAHDQGVARGRVAAYKECYSMLTALMEELRSQP